MMKEHFQTLYDKAPFDHFVYDSKRLGKVRQFATSNQIQIMVINIQSFQKDVADKELAEMTEEELKKLNVINRENDRMSGRRPSWPHVSMFQRRLFSRRRADDSWSVGISQERLVRTPDSGST
jgi:hypothetical protein